MLYISPTTVAAQKHIEARQNLEEARRMAKERGETRRLELRKWVEDGGMKGFGADIGHGGPQQGPQRIQSADDTFGKDEDQE
jgi:hypothetical protein